MSCEICMTYLPTYISTGFPLSDFRLTEVDNGKVLGDWCLASRNDD